MHLVWYLQNWYCQELMGPLVLFMKKKDGSMRPCVDYRKLNAQNSQWYLPASGHWRNSRLCYRRESCPDQADKIWLTGRYQESYPRWVESSIYKVGFVSMFGTFIFNVIQVSLSNAPVTFQRMMPDRIRTLCGAVGYYRHLLLRSPCSTLIGESDIAYASRTLNTTEVNSAPTHLEALQVVLDCLTLSALSRWEEICVMHRPHWFIAWWESQTEPEAS
jgi:hypothetical protein